VGLDMIGPLPTTLGGFNRVLVAMDKFTKWVKVNPVTYPKADRVLDFLVELVHRYGLAHHIITNLGSNFNNHPFWEYCKNSVLGNSGKPITLETLSLTKFSKHVFQEQGIRDSRKPGTCEALNSRMCRVRES
jgi:hypothetical protein